MGVLNRFLQALSIFLSALGVIMNFAGGLIPLLPSGVLTDQQVRIIGLAIFVIGVLLFMLATFISRIFEDATEPRLSVDLLETRFKPLYTQYTLGGQPIMTEPSPHSELDFAFLDIVNNPKNRERGRTADKTRAQIFFKLKGETKYIKYGRWCNEEMPLFQPSEDGKALRQVDIDPENPETLVVAFKRKNSDDIYSFSYNDHKRTATKEEIDALCKERLIGKAPINFQLRLGGKFAPKTFDLLLNINEKGEFVINEKKKFNWQNDN